MSDWEDETDVAKDNVPRNQPAPQRGWISVGARRKNVNFGTRPARHERTDESPGARQPGQGGRGRVSDETRGRAQPLVFNVENPETGRIIGKPQSL